MASWRLYYSFIFCAMLENAGECNIVKVACAVHGSTTQHLVNLQQQQVALIRIQASKLFTHPIGYYTNCACLVCLPHVAQTGPNKLTVV